jgi:hypothetical protein
LFRLLGIHPGRTFTATAADALAGREAGATRLMLEELVQAHLLTEESCGRYGRHELLRAYALELCDDPAAERRLLDFYLHSAYAAGRRCRPRRDGPDLEPPAEPVPLEPFRDCQSALGWLTAEHQALIAVADRAATLGLERHARRLRWIVLDHQRYQRPRMTQPQRQGAGVEAKCRGTVGPRVATASR